MEMKPCVICEFPCEIFPVQIGDFATLTFLRICSDKCLWETAYDYLYKLYEHKGYRQYLYDLQNNEDKKQKEDFLTESINYSSNEFQKHIKENPNMLSMPMPDFAKSWANKPSIPSNGTTMMRFTRTSKDNRIKYTKERIEKLKIDLETAEKDLKELEGK